jgi:tyrosine-protein kinase Etk/Wzc
MNDSITKDNLNENFEEKTLKDYYKILARHKWYIIIIAIIITALGFYKTITSPSIYQSKAKVMIEEQSNASDIFQFGSNFTNRTMANELEILQSRELKARLVINLWDSPLKNNLYILGTRKINNGESIFTGIKKKTTAFAKNILTGVTTTKVKIDPQNEYSQLNQWVSQRIEELPEGLTLSELDKITDKIKFEVDPSRESTIINLSYKSPGEKEAQLVLEKFINIYQTTDQERSAQEFSKLNTFLDDKLRQREQELRQARNRLERYQEQNLVFGVGEENRGILEQATNIESQYYNAQADVEIKEKELALLRAQLSDRESKLADKVGSVIDSELRALRGELVQLQSKLIRTINKYNEGHPEVARINKEIKSVKERISNKTNQLIQQGISVSDPISFSQELVSRILRAESELAALKSREEQYEKLVDRYNNRLRSLPQKQLRYAQLRRELDVLEQNYVFLREKQQETKINRAFEAGKVKIIDHASNSEQVEPNFIQDVLLSILIGLGLGVGFALIKNSFNNKLRSIDDLEFSSVPVLSTIPNISSVSKKISKDTPGKVGPDMISFYKPLHPISESYRNLRTNIKLSIADKEVKSILVTSPGPAEGKTTIACNLGISYANMGQKTIIIDSDLRKSNVHNAFGLSRKKGLVDYLTNDIPVKDIIKETKQNNLFIISAGGHPPNPSELLNSKKMSKLMSHLREIWDNIIYDSPPIIPVTDSLILSNNVDFIIVSTMVEKTHRPAVIHALEKFKRVNSEVNGFVMNGIEKRHRKYSKYGYNYRRYYKYYSDASKS